jgi:hypothetical protein
MPWKARCARRSACGSAYPAAALEFAASAARLALAAARPATHAEAAAAAAATEGDEGEKGIVTQQGGEN